MCQDLSVPYNASANICSDTYNAAKRPLGKFHFKSMTLLSKAFELQTYALDAAKVAGYSFKSIGDLNSADIETVKSIQVAESV
ncbi:hypothetical protein BGZ91_005134 [Linnemannia elongata]|nr:hypothetical protein BGZ91_005134 [Linnemannia elongata]